MIENSSNVVVYSPILSFADWNPISSTELQDFKPRIDRLKANSHELFDKAANVAMKWAAIETGAIEGLYETDRGFTFSVATQANTVQIVRDRRGEDFAQHLSAQLAAYEYILDFATGKQELALAWLRQLHSVVCAAQETHKVLVNDTFENRELEKGQFKTMPNNVTTLSGMLHQYCPVEDVNQQMQFLIDQTRTREFLSASGVSQASYVHHAFAQIHPFSDGNGRVARALASIYLYRELSIPMVIFDDQRTDYFDALEAADLKNTKVFQKFMERLVESTIEMIEINVRSASLPSLQEQKESLKNTLKIGENLAPSDLKKLVDELAGLVGRTLSEKSLEYMDGMEKHLVVNTSVMNNGTRSGTKIVQKPVGHAESGFTIAIFLTLKDMQAPSPKVVHEYTITIPEKTSEVDYFSLIRMKHSKAIEESVSIHVDELSEKINASTIYKVDSWCSFVLALAVDEFMRMIK